MEWDVHKFEKINTQLSFDDNLIFLVSIDYHFNQQGGINLGYCLPTNNFVLIDVQYNRKAI